MCGDETCSVQITKRLIDCELIISLQNSLKTAKLSKLYGKYGKIAVDPKPARLQANNLLIDGESRFHLDGNCGTGFSPSMLNGSTESLMISERRRHQRKTFTELISVELGAHNSGLILNASEGGLAFHAGSPIQAREEIRFAISLDRSRRLEGQGRLEWTDGGAKTAGLQFTEVSEDFRNEMRVWLAETNGPLETQEPSVTSSEDTPSEGTSSFFAADMLRPAFRVELPKEQERPAPREAHHPPAPRRKRKSRTPHSARPEAQSAPTSPIEYFEVSDSVHAESNTQPQAPENTHVEQETKSEGQVASEKAAEEISRRALASLNKHAENLERQSQKQAEDVVARVREATAETERRLSELREFGQIQAERMKEVLKQAGQVSQRLEHLATELEKVQQQKLNYFEAQLQDLSDRHIGELQQRAALLLGSSPSAEGGSRSGTNGWMMSIMLAGLLVLIGAMLLSYHREAGAAFSWIGQRLGGEPQEAAKPPAEVQAPEPKATPEPKPTPPPQPMAARPAMDKDARALWSRAAKGDTSAEVDLAKLYLAGKGVVKSCVQARLLLGAAADKGNQDATQLLRQLERDGCH
jgi:TPR repeat protein